ncbi:mechanosensitive ion channel family protein [Planomonospora parontospora]|uniref:mechanosensitive ion channel family protein n=1 Tax=Planomonospora parontospora TaxID=58119 RepID=UPI0019BEF191|nr:mechanosensitive ion channel family protein [Planomonospora parontospora]GGL44120.1 mechanosensitive ion channel protein MscS [Planomonospora parontospora subsp. antibiotica]GII18588.1 mechanosensitive ion channel protein MscS [Planomonospora parontospora subsp. antibiotica]
MFLLSPSPSPTPSPTPAPSSTPGTSVLELPLQMTEGLSRACKSNGEADIVCDLVSSVLPAAWAPVIGGLIAISLIMLVAFVLRNVSHRLITRVVRRASSGNSSIAGRLRGRQTVQPEGLDAVAAERRRQRSETIGSVLRSVSSIVIIGTAILTVLERLSVPIAPLLTSVGIIGVALGFGAQELVKDFIAGMFMLLEDQYGVGDVIDAGPATGTVEAVTLRITRLRDADGRVWYVRNGTITRVGNESQGWSRATVDVPVAYSAEVPAVREILSQVAEEMWEDPAFRDSVIVEEPQVWGIEQISDTAVVFRISAKTIPSRQAEVAREIRLRVKAALDRASITIAG